MHVHVNPNLRPARIRHPAAGRERLIRRALRQAGMLFVFGGLLAVIVLYGAWIAALGR